MKIHIRRPSPAFVVAVLALVVAMSGTAVAAVALHSGDKLIAKRSLSGNRLRLNTVTGAEVAEGKLGTVPKANLAAHLPALVWHDLTLINDWQNYWGTDRAPAWAVDAQGIVHLRGVIFEASNVSDQFTTLPAAIRPALTVWLTTNLLGANPGRIMIMTDGSTTVADPSGGGLERLFTDLDGVTYGLP